ncbi:MAG: MarR family transcriptional regulator [Gemmatimonadota bacterium]
MPARLQDEIKQTKPFPRRSSEALLAVLRTASVLDQALNDALRPHGITSTQYNVLRILRGAGEAGLCGREVGQRLVSSVPDVSRLLDRMEETGLVRRERDPNDRRHVTARITAKGLRIAEDCGPALESVERHRVGDLDAKTLETVIGALAAIREPG